VSSDEILKNVRGKKLIHESLVDESGVDELTSYM